MCEYRYKFAAKTHRLACGSSQFFGEDPGILILPDENRDQILSYFVGKDKIEEINTRFEKFVNDESIGFSDYVYGNYHVQFFRDENQKPYIQVTFP